MKNCLLLILLIKVSASLNAQSLSWLRIDSCSSVPTTSSVIITNNKVYTVVNCDQQISYVNGMFSSPAQNSIVRMSASGNYEMSIGNFQRLENFVVDSSGNIYVVGKDSLIDNTFYSCCKFDSVGNLLWHFPIGTNYGVLVTYTTLVSDGFVFGGDWTNNAWPGGASFNLFIAKADFNGNLKFLHKFDNYNTGRIDKIIESGNNILVAGSFFSYITINDSSNSITLNGYQEYFAKYNSSGILLSAKVIPTTVCTYSMTADPFGNIIFGNWHDTAGLVLYTYSDTGTQISTEHIAEAGNNSKITGLKFDSAGNLYVDCWFSDSITINNSQTFYTPDLDDQKILFRRNSAGINDWTLYSNCPYCYGSFDIYGDCDIVFNSFYWDSTEVFGIHYYNPRGNILMKLHCAEENSIQTINTKLDFEIFPNPSSGIFTVDLRNTTVATQICVFDLLGNCLSTKNCRNETNPKIDLSSQPKGLYFMEIVSDGKKSVNKIVLH